MPASASRPSCVVYVDGYNWYHAIFRFRPEWKWLNIQSFFEYLRSRENVTAVKVFSAMVVNEPDARYRQETYFKALRTLPKLKIILGLFQPREVTCRADCRKKYYVQEEKKTDVNMTVELMADAISDSCPDRICIVTGDSDIQPAVEWIAKNRPRVKITVYVPALPADQATRRIDYYKTRGLPVDCVFLPVDSIKDHQFKGAVKVGVGQFVSRPTSWSAGRLAELPLSCRHRRRTAFL